MSSKFKPLFADVRQKGPSLPTKSGVKVLAAYALEGHHDFLWITEYPDHEAQSY
jgi:uncharacterized protein with GYD domain